MNERRADRRDIEAAWTGWPVPEVIGGAIVGGIVGLSAVTVIPYLASLVPNVGGMTAGGIVGALLSWIWRPQRAVLVQERHAETRQQHLRRAA